MSQKSKFDEVLDLPRDAGTKATATSVRRGKSADPDRFRKVTVYVSREVYKDAKIALLEHDGALDFSDLVEQQLVAWLKSRSVYVM